MGHRLPAHHVTAETKNLVSVSMAVVATVSTLVLGLLISNANTSFIARNGQVTGLSANILRLDQMLRLYGPEADPARAALRQYAEHKTVDLFPDRQKMLHGSTINQRTGCSSGWRRYCLDCARETSASNGWSLRP